MTFYELYRDDRERFMQAVTEQVNWARVARLLDKNSYEPTLKYLGQPLPTEEAFQDAVFAELRIPLLDAIDELEATTDKAPASEAADDVISQSRRQDAGTK